MPYDKSSTRGNYFKKKQTVKLISSSGQTLGTTVESTERRALAHRAFSNTVPKTMQVEKAIDPRRFQSSRVDVKQRDSYGFLSGAHTKSLLRGTMPSYRYSNRRQSQSNTCQELISFLPRPSPIPDVVKRFLRRDND